jgi:hypothetical protein
MGHNYDAYGGIQELKGEKTGFFHLEQIGGRTWFVTPEGHAFLSLGVNHIDSSALKYPDRVHVWETKYGSEETFFKEGVRVDLIDWGFNTVGWAQEVCVADMRHTPPWPHVYYQWIDMPYCHQLPFTEIESWNKYPRFPDVFSDEFEQWCDLVARYHCVNMRDDPNLIGYFYADIPGWHGHRTGAWWSDVGDPGTDEGQAALRRIAERYYAVIHDAIRRYDPNHLLLGDRYNGNAGIPDVVLEAARDTVDVISVQHFWTMDMFKQQMAHWNAVTGKPIINADFAWHLTPFGQRRHGISTQRDRGEHYARWAQELFTDVPYFVGWHWCAYIENKFRQAGLKNGLDEPFTEAIAPMREANSRIYEFAGAIKSAP